MNRIGAGVACAALAAGCWGSGSDGGGLHDHPDASTSDDASQADARTPPIDFADRSWQEAEQTGTGDGPVAAIDPAGTAITSWNVFGSDGCFVRRKEGDQAWGEHVLHTPQAVRDSLVMPGTTEETRRDFCDLGLSMDGSGRALAFFRYERGVLDDGSGEFTTWETGMRAAFDPASDWGVPEQSGPNVAILPPLDTAATMNLAGDAVSVWTYGGEAWARRTDGDGWTDPASIATSTRAYTQPIVVMDGDGGALAVFRLDTYRLMGARLVDGVWSPAARIDDGAGFKTNIYQVAMNASGEALLVWVECDQVDACTVRGRRLDPVSGWQPSEPISTDIGSFVAVAIDEAGNGMAVWTAQLANPGGGDSIPLLAAARYEGGAWSEQEAIGGGEAEAGAWGWTPVVAMDAVGDGIVAWQLRRPDTEIEGRYSIEFQARTFIAGTGFEAMESIDQVPDEIGSGPALAMSAQGAAVLAWGADDVAWARFFR